MRRSIQSSRILKPSSSCFLLPSIRTSPINPFVASLHRASPPRMASQFTLRKIAAPNTLDYRIYVEKDGSPVSIFHDIPLHSNKEKSVFNMIVEIPRWTNPKLEISRDELLNPIKQDTKNGKLRFVRNRFPHKGYIWNYGALPQTWEDPNVVHPDTGAKGDNDPLDALEIGERVSHVGEIKQVKPLGVMGLLDDGETDWKILVIDVKDPLADKLNDIDDINKHMPGLLPSTRDWFRFYKVPDGKPENKVAFGGEFKDRKYALHIIEECGEAWERLITKKTPAGEVNIANLTVENSPARIKPEDLPRIPPNEDLQPHEIDKSIDKWFFLGDDKK